MDEEFYTVDVDIRETAQVNVSLRDCLNGIKSIKKTTDRANTAFKLLEAIQVDKDGLTPDQIEITVKWLETTLSKFK